MMRAPRIDAHVHFWNPARGDYGWMPKDDAVLARPYAPADLAPQLAEGARVVLVQAAPTMAETEYMLGIADATPWVAGVVGWVDFERPEARADLERLAAHPKLLGVRPMIQDIPDVDWMLRPAQDWAFAALVELDLTFDALGFPRHLANFDRLLARWPDLRVVVDHCMKPAVGDAASFAAWAEGIGRLADRGAFCKLSGLVTEGPADWTVEMLRPYAELVLGRFGAERVLWGSDWPVCRLRAEYGRWRAAAEALTAHLSDADRASVFGGSAARFYRLPV
jgi:L-fuconolactonase